MNKLKFKLLTTIAAFDNQPGWKLDENGNIQLKDGNPVYVDASGQEKIIHTDTISRLSNEAKTHRIAKEELENKYKPFEGLDAEVARKAVETVSKLDAKQLIDAGKVDELKQQITNQFQTQLSEKENAYKALETKLNDMYINNVFANSEFVRNNLAIPRDMFEAYFRNNFKVEDGQVAAYGKDGQRLISKTRHGEYADPEEALQLLVEAHPQKDVILRADVGSGSGNSGAGGGAGRGRTIKRADFAAYPPAKQAEISAKIRAGEMQLTD